jgi:hypothetical protein
VRGYRDQAVGSSGDAGKSGLNEWSTVKLIVRWFFGQKGKE